jgi:tripartite-type tricarboxylate transporter receptor subunit TctC
MSDAISRWSRRALAVVGAVLATTAMASAQDYPTRAVTIVVPFGAGSVTDTTARAIAQHLSEKLGQPFIVENRAGSGGLLGANQVAKAAGDGYTFLITSNTTHSAAPGLFKNVPYDPIKDFTPVARIGSFPSFVVVNPSVPFTTMKEMVAHANANPGKLSCAHGNSTGHITCEAIKQRTKSDIVRIAYRSNPPAITDLLAGHVPAMVADFGTAMPHVKTGKLRALAVLTKERSDVLPDVPTLHETVMPNYDLLAWAGMFAPAGLPPAIAERISKELEGMLTNPATKEKFRAMGVEVFYTGTKEFDAYVKSELTKWTTLIKEVGIEPQ